MSVYIFFEVQLILEQYKYELCQSTYTHIFFNKFIEKNLEIHNNLKNSQVSHVA